ncbi:hypothetical protein KKJ06_20160 [Xenorhabdus bovienii]|uniref:hypothetical protein n=1 Tax=Xenorhabdus bovienii TaxID=40576 RepID=UPI0023B2FFB3|nr:hypothetical protein [Xenorhabdus bovienii]MDE9557667.1 hypothetical protein [Xenorhabdus bovienii]
MRSTIANKSGEWGQTIGTLLQGNAQDSDRVESAFNILGMTIVQDIKDTIEQGVSPPNHPTTVAAKARKGLWELAKEEGITLDQAIKLVANMIDIRRANLPKDGQIPVVCNG